MTKIEKEELYNIIHNEGFDYTFYGYSEFPEIKDKQFHKLRKAFLKARDRLKQYVKDPSKTYGPE